MTPETRNSSLLGNGGKQVPAEVYTMQKLKNFVSMQRRGKHTNITIEELLGNGVFYVVRAEML
jgi:hypothetical protein